ncbi:hypothetical protein DPX39_040008600 [Trypanosoma brucei equiperdum]|uniref:Uncharacterized protein n=1 Tax=Trypanosoma brucei equiperdum TaxID=630700 RepID=A0A3L6LEC2_9TRYP|nr:hypothetical protein DPX39_040008600 [Trypanosoma brucei equiperdum]
MAYVSNAVKQQLRASRSSYTAEAVHAAYKMLQEFEESSEGDPSLERNVSSELYILCTEAAIEKKEWALAEACLKKYTGRRAQTKALEARALYCDALVALSGVPHSLRGRAKLAAHIRCATKIVSGIKIVLEEWPKEPETLIAGIDYLWLSIQDVCGRIISNSMLDILVLVVTLHEKLSLGGIHTQLQWIVRYAVCLRATGRVQDALNQIVSGAELVAKTGSERLQLQFYRIQVAFTASTSSNRTKQDNTRPVFQALAAVYSFFCGATDDSSAKQELIQATEKLLGDPEKKEVKQKGRKAAEAEAAFRDPAIISDVLSEVALALAMCGADDTCNTILPKLLNGDNARARLFTEYAKAIMRARDCGSLAASKALDAGYLTKNMAEKLFACIGHVEDVIDAARTSVDVSESMYAIEVGCVVLWNLCLPLLQPQTRGRLRLTLSRIVMLLRLCNSRLNRLFVRAAYESALAEFEEENMNATIEQIDKALAVEQLSGSADNTSAYPMEFALMWLRRRAVVRKAHEGTSFISDGDHIVHLIEQARLASANRVPLLQAAADRLPPITRTESVAETRTKNVSVNGEKNKGGKSRKQDVVRETVDERVPFTFEDFSTPNVYYLLLKEASTTNDPAVDEIIIKAAEGLARIAVPDNGFARDLLAMKAEAHLVMSELLEKRGQTSPRALGDATHEDGMSHISKAAQLGARLSAAGYGGGWIVLNACTALINQNTEMFKKGLFLPAAATLRDLSLALGQVNADPMGEYKLFDSIGFGYVMSLVQTYISAKGEVNGELHCESLAETMRKTYLYPICEAHNSVLKQAAEACHQIMSKWSLPSRRKNFSLILPCINRLLDRTHETSTHPQEQLLFLLGRLNGPIELDERRHLVNTECLDMLRADPSVELCARLASHSVQIPQNERVTLEICRTADRLYHEGKLGWGTKSLITVNSGRDKSLASTVVSTQQPSPSVMYLRNLKGSVVANSNGGMQPKPSDMDWYWYADILLHEATLFLHLGVGADRTHRLEFEKRVLVAITNSAVAASRSIPEAQITQITKAYRALCRVATSISRASYRVLQLGLRILLSPPILRIVNKFLRSRTNGRCDAEFDDLCTLTSTLGGYLFTNLLEDENYDEGIKQMHELLRVLPSRYHGSLCAYEARLRTKLRLSTSELHEKARTVDAEVEAAVCVAVAKNAHHISEGMRAWNQALKILEGKPVQRADLVLSMAEWLAGRNAVTKSELISLLMNGLSDLERVDSMLLSAWLNKSAGRRNTDVSPALRHALTGTMVGRTFAIAQSLTCTNVVPVDKQKDLPSLLETLTALRLLYFLFVVAPITPCASRPFVYKRCCASTLLYYVLSCWKVVAVLLQIHRGEDIRGVKVDPLHLPETLYEWRGFHANPQHAIIIRDLCKDGLALNTHRLWGMLLDVCDYLLEDGMELYVFLILSWVEFCIYWRYDESDPRGRAAVRAVRLKGFISAARCGWAEVCDAYNVEPPDAECWSSVNEVLLSTETPALSVPWPSSGPLDFSNFVGSTHRFILSEAEDLFTLGRVQEALLWKAKVKQCASRTGDRGALARCHLLEARASILRGRWDPPTSEEASAEDSTEEETKTEDMGDGEGTGLPTSLTVAAWTELQLVHIDGFLSCDKVAEAVAFVRQLLTRLLWRLEEVGEGDIEKDTTEMCHKVLLQRCAPRFVAFLRRPFDTLFPGGPREGDVKGLLDEVCSQLDQYADWKSRLVSLRVRQILRPCVDDVLATGKGDVDKALPERLFNEYSEILKVADMLQSEVNAVVPVLALGGDVTTCPSAAAAYDEVLVMCARNCLERKLLKNFISQRFSALSVADLGIPTGGPVELEGYVASYMRDPALYEQSRMLNDSANAALPSQEGICGHDNEVASSLSHFGIPLNYMVNTSTPHIEALLYRAMGGVGTVSSVQMEASIIAALSEFRRRLTAATRAMESPEASVNTTFSGDVNERENAFLTAQWSKITISVPHPSVPRRMSVAERRAAKLASIHVEDPNRLAANTWIEINSNLQMLLLAAVRQARHMFEYKQMAKCYIYLAHNFMLSGNFNAAGTAIEYAETAAMYGFVSDLVTSLTHTTPEAELIRLVNKTKMDAPHLVNTKAFDSMRNNLMEISSMWRRFDLVGAWPAEPNKGDPLLSDICTLSAVREGTTSYFLVAFRRQDGEVCSRRAELDMGALRECTSQIEELKRLKKVEVAAGPSAGERSPDAKWGSVFHSYLEKVRTVVFPLLGDFSDLFSSQRAASCSLYLCLDPILQPLPFEQLPELSSFMAVHRELSVLNLRQKTALRTGKPQSNGVAYIIDPFGENEEALQYIFGGGRTKTSNAEIVTFVKDGQGSSSRPSLAYVHRIFANKAYANVLVSACGSFSDIIKPSVIAELSLDHLQTVLIAMATNDASYCREQGCDTCRAYMDFFYEKNYVVSILLLARGVHHVLSNIFTLTASECNVFSKRCLSFVGGGGGKALAEAVKGSNGDAAGPSTQLHISYGVIHHNVKAK